MMTYLLISMMMWVLAEAGADSMSLRDLLPWITTFAIAIITAVLAPVLKNRWRDDAKREVALGPQPFEVRLKEEFVTRREFERLEAAVEVNMTKVEGMFEKTFTAITSQNTTLIKKVEGANDRLTKKIEEVAGGAYASRQKIWVEVNNQREKVSALQATGDVADQIGKLAEALKPPVAPKIQPTHTHPNNS